MVGVLDDFFSRVESSPSAQVGLQLLSGQDLGSAAAQGTKAARANAETLRAQSQRDTLNETFQQLSDQGVDITAPDFASKFVPFAASKGIDASTTLSALNSVVGVQKSLSDVAGQQSLAATRQFDQRLLSQILPELEQQGFGLGGGTQVDGVDIPPTAPTQAVGGLTQSQKIAAVLGDRSIGGRLAAARAEQESLRGAPRRAGAEAESKELAKLSVQAFSKAQTSARESTEDRQNLKALRLIDPDTGTFAEDIAKFSNVLRSFGVTGGQAATDFRTANSIMTGLGFGVLKGEGQVSDGERVLIKQTLPQISDPREAFQFNVSRLDNAASRVQLAGKLFRDFKKANGTTQGAEEFVTESMKQMPAIIANPKGGLPLWFVDFERRAKDNAKAQGQKITEDEILEKWLILNGR